MQDSGDNMAKSKSKKKNTKAQKKPANNIKEDEKAANRRGIIIVAVIVILFVGFIIAVAVSGNKKNADTPSTTLSPEEAISQAVEDFEV